MKLFLQTEQLPCTALISVEASFSRGYGIIDLLLILSTLKALARCNSLATRTFTHPYRIEINNYHTKKSHSTKIMHKLQIAT